MGQHCRFVKDGAANCGVGQPDQLETVEVAREA